jgi:hypothetical protein
MKNTRRPGICNCCKQPVAAGLGVIRYWNGAARRRVPKYAQTTPYGVVHALLCEPCDAARLRKLLADAVTS